MKMFNIQLEFLDQHVNAFLAGQQVGSSVDVIDHFLEGGDF